MQWGFNITLFFTFWIVHEIDDSILPEDVEQESMSLPAQSCVVRLQEMGPDETTEDVTADRLVELVHQCLT